MISNSIVPFIYPIICKEMPLGIMQSVNQAKKKDEEEKNGIKKNLKVQILLKNNKIDTFS